jgi:hypothetical protein
MRLQDKSLDISRSISRPLNLSTRESATEMLFEKEAKPQVAIFITHGMGQQVPFETIDSIAEGLAEAAKRQGKPVKEFRARTVQVDGTKTQRIELDMRDAQDKEIEIHIYEGYWAPITEGQVSLRDVISFLFRAGCKGLLNSFSFQRWIFGRAVPFGCQITAALRLIITFGILLSLVVLNTVIATVAGYKFLGTNTSLPYPETLFNTLTSVVGLYVIASLIFILPLWGLSYLPPFKAHPFIKPLWNPATWLVQKLFQLWLLVTIASGLIILLLITQCLTPSAWIIPWLSQHKLWIWLSQHELWIWLGLFIVSIKVRQLFVQYLGDVAAYVDSHSLDKFNDMRSKIKTKVFEQAKAVYSNPQYEHISMIGHSLGSVITYDTLNALINHDELNEKSLNVINRTRLLITFGSPLDKIAFLFASQIRKATATREALAATLQPLIQQYVPFRSIKWINIYAPRDIVSGKLEFYDDIKNAEYSTERKIDNIIDKEATIPLIAHTEYWKNPLLFDLIYENLGTSSSI